MRSSISDSKGLNARAAIVLLLGTLVLYFCVLEASTRLIVPSFSEGERRMRNDYRAALALLPTTPAGSRTVLVVGNSLLLRAVVRSQLENNLPRTYAVRLFPIEATTFFDWYFGLRRFFAEGSRPGVVILCMSLRHLTSDSTDGARFAHFMMQWTDLPEVKKTTGLDMMNASNYFFANMSSWLGMSSSVRNALLEKLIPDAASLVADFAQVQPVPLAANPAVIRRSLERLRELKDLCETYGAHFIMLIPPTLNRTDPAPAVALAAGNEGISVLIPYQPAELPAKAFSDGFHLNRQGAELFTSRLGKELPQVLAKE